MWNNSKKLKFYYQRERYGVESSFLRPLEISKENLEEREVGLRRFDSMPIEIKKPCFVKIDVEGAEDRVLEGLGEVLKEIDFIQLEQTHINKNEEKGMMSKNIRLLEDFGFTGFLQVNTTYYEDGFPMKSDLIFFRDTRDKKT